VREGGGGQREMEKGKEVSSSLVPGPELPPAPKNKMNCTIIKFVLVAVVIGVVLFLLFSGDPDEGMRFFYFVFISELGFERKVIWCGCLFPPSPFL